MLQLFAVLSGNFSTYTLWPPTLQPVAASFGALVHTDIVDIAQAICRQRAHVVCLLRHPDGRAIATEQALLRALSTDCAEAAVVRILDDFQLRSAAADGRPLGDARQTHAAVAESSVYVLVLAQARYNIYHYLGIWKIFIEMM